MYTLNEAAKATGKSKTAVHKALVSGRISGTRDDLGRWKIDPAELHRVFPPVDTKERKQGTSEDVIELAVLRQKVAMLENQFSKQVTMLESQLSREREINADLQKDRDQWRNQATTLLPGPRAGVFQRFASGFWTKSKAS